MTFRLYSRQVLRALVGHGGSAVEDETINWLTRKGVLRPAPVDRRGLYASSELFILRAALELTSLGVTASHLTGIASTLRQILIAGPIEGLDDIESDRAEAAVTAFYREALHLLSGESPEQVHDRTADRDQTSLAAWQALERARLGLGEALILFWFAEPDAPVEWQIRTEGEMIYGPLPTNLPPKRRGYLALDWANVARGL